jgi:hypothetical protein
MKVMRTGRPATMASRGKTVTASPLRKRLAKIDRDRKDALYPSRSPSTAM